MHIHAHTPVEGRKQAAGGQHEGAAGQDGALVVDPVQVAAGHVSHADGAGRAVQELVAIPGRECILFSPCASAKGGEMHFFFLKVPIKFLSPPMKVKFLNLTQASSGL